MFKNRNGYWMSPGFGKLFAPDGGDGGNGGDASGSITIDAAQVDTGDVAGSSVIGADNADAGSDDGKNSTEALNAEIARLNAEMAKQKAALDKATSEAGNLRKELRSKMTQDQIDAAEKAEAAEKAAKELEELRRKVAKGDTVKSVMGKLGLDEDSAGNLADHLFGAVDIDNALLEIQKAWKAKEAALRKEYGKITGPGAGADSNSPEAIAIARAAAIGKTRNAQNEQAQKAMEAYLR